MYGKILKAFSFQAKTARVFWAFLFGTSLLLFVIAADATDPDSSGITVSIAGDTAAMEMVPDSPVVVSSPAVSGITDTPAPHTRLRTSSPRQPRFGGQRGRLIARFGETVAQKLSGSTRYLQWLRAQYKKMLFLLGSLVLILFTISFYREKREKGRFLTTTRLSVMDKEVQRACRYIEEHYSDPTLDLQDICTALVTGGAFLEALFVKELGLTIEEFICRVRINRAKIALRGNAGQAADALAATVGFGDEATFRERFTAITGVDFENYRSSLAAVDEAAAS